MRLDSLQLVAILLIGLLAPFQAAMAQLRPDGATASFLGSLPPKKTVDISTEQKSAWIAKLDELTSKMSKVKLHPRAADADVLLKAVRYALAFDEWYERKPEDTIKKVEQLFSEAANRIEGLQSNRTPWLNGTGQKLLGFYSNIDDSPQPFGIDIPKDLVVGPSAPTVPMWIWLHGRGDTTTDLSFIYNQLVTKKPGQFQPTNMIVIYPFGRYCNGWKSAGETDVMEAMQDATDRFNVDRDRIAIAGFSMGGAGAWHLGAHFTDLWACVHTGAGFVDVKRYQKLTPAKMPVWYEQKLWGIYDVPNYVRNFQNVPLVCYSGEIDPQRDSAEYMIEELAKIGLKPPHLIGPETGHKYHPDSLKDVQSRIEAALVKGRPKMPMKVTLQTRTLAYSRMHWLQINRLEKQWDDATVEATIDESAGVLRIESSNVSGLAIRLPTNSISNQVRKVIHNGKESPVPIQSKSGFVSWDWDSEIANAKNTLRKRPGLQGPMDDGFRSRFVVVLPDFIDDSSSVGRWVNSESSHFLVRWQALMRGDARVLKPNEVTDLELRECNLVLWGTPNSNSLIKRVLQDSILGSVLRWTDAVVQIGDNEAPASTSVPVMCYPNPMNPDRYVILNTGLTFREAHDRTNSLQNPKLPDWAIMDVSQPATTEAAGKVISANFFDNHWKP